MPGVIGRKQNPEWVRKRIQSRLETFRKRGAFPCKGRKASSEERRNSSERLKKFLKERPEWLEKLRMAGKRPRGPQSEARKALQSKLLKGRIFSLELRMKISEGVKRQYKINPNYGMRGKPNPSRGKPNLKHKGPLHYNWKGGKTAQNHKFYISIPYREWRISIFKRDKYVCQKCGGGAGRLNAHHLLPVEHFPQFRIDPWNGVTLCNPCHRRVHKIYRRYNLCPSPI